MRANVGGLKIAKGALRRIEAGRGRAGGGGAQKAEEDAYCGGGPVHAESAGRRGHHLRGYDFIIHLLLLMLLWS